jgi:hypothetical protein
MKLNNKYIDKILDIFKNDSVILKSFEVAKRNNDYNIEELFRRGKKGRPKNKRVRKLELQYKHELNGEVIIEEEYIDESLEPKPKRYIATQIAEKIKRVKNNNKNNKPKKSDKELIDEWLLNNKPKIFKAKEPVYKKYSGHLEPVPTNSLQGVKFKNDVMDDNSSINSSSF